MTNALRWATALTAIVIATGGTAWLAYRLLTWPIGAIAYFELALPLTWACYVIAFYAWRGGRAKTPLRFRSVATSIAAHIVILAVAFYSVYEVVPQVSGDVIQFLYHRDPIGVGDDVARPPCRTREVTQLPNGRGLIADVRETYCGGNWDGDLMYFVFLHHRNEQNTRQNLIFRYWADTLPNTTPPSVSWTSTHNLSITANSNVLDVTKRQLRDGQVSITYNVISEKATPAE